MVERSIRQAESKGKTGGGEKSPSSNFMKTILSYIASFGLGLLIIAPPLDYSIPVMVNSYAWVYVAIVSGFFGMFIMSQKVHSAIKTLSAYLFITCFYSAAPYLSFNAYILIVLSIYGFILMQECDYKILLNVLESVFWFEVILAVMQLLGRDKLINFDRAEPVFLGTVMQYMRFSSVLAVVAPFLLIKNKWYIVPLGALCVISQSSSFSLAVIGGVGVYFFLICETRDRIRIALGTAFVAVIYALFIDRTSFNVAFTCGRVGVWADIVRTWIMDTTGPSNVLPLHGPVDWKATIFGHGIDMFMPLFPIYKHDPNPFGQAHNDWLQILWEIGLVGFGLFMAYVVSLMKRLYALKEYIFIGGLFILGINMFFAFPQRMTQTMFLMVAYSAFCEQRIKEGFYYADIK